MWKCECGHAATILTYKIKFFGIGILPIWVHGDIIRVKGIRGLFLSHECAECKCKKVKNVRDD